MSENPVIHASGNWDQGQVRTIWSPQPRQIPQQVADKIESAWSAAMRRKDVKLFDGKMSRLESWRVDGGVLELILGETSYKQFWGTNLMNAHLADEFGPACLANALGISAVVQSSDGFLVFGRRSGNVSFHAHRIHCFGGTVDDGRTDVFAEILRELEEEVSLRREDLQQIRCVGLAEDREIRQPELMFHTVAFYSLDEITKRLDAHEHTAVWSVAANKDAIERAMNDAELTPVAVAGLRLAAGLPRR
jgi:NUDIX domain